MFLGNMCVSMAKTIKEERLKKTPFKIKAVKTGNTMLVLRIDTRDTS